MVNSAVLDTVKQVIKDLMQHNNCVDYSTIRQHTITHNPSIRDGVLRKAIHQLVQDKYIYITKAQDGQVPDRPGRRPTLYALFSEQDANQPNVEKLDEKVLENQDDKKTDVVSKVIRLSLMIHELEKQDQEIYHKIKDLKAHRQLIREKIEQGKKRLRSYGPYLAESSRSSDLTEEKMIEENKGDNPDDHDGHDGIHDE
jgi:hypothetical protein